MGWRGLIWGYFLIHSSLFGAGWGRLGSLSSFLSWKGRGNETGWERYEKKGDMWRMKKEKRNHIVVGKINVRVPGVMVYGNFYGGGHWVCAPPFFFCSLSGFFFGTTMPQIDQEMVQWHLMSFDLQNEGVLLSEWIQTERKVEVLCNVRWNWLIDHKVLIRIFFSWSRFFPLFPFFCLLSGI